MLEYKIRASGVRLYYPKLVKFKNGNFGVKLKKHWWNINNYYLILKQCYMFDSKNEIYEFNSYGRVNEDTILSNCSNSLLEVRSAYEAYKKVRDISEDGPFETIIGRIKKEE